MGDSQTEMKESSGGIQVFDASFSNPAAVEVPLPKNRGAFVPLKTTLETRAREKIGKVFVTCVPAKLASTVLNVVRKLIPDDGGIDLQHLRRFAKLKDLPPHIRELLAGPSSSTPPELFLMAGPISAIPSTDLSTALTSILGDVYLVEVDVPMLAPTSQEQATTWTTKYWPTVYKKSNPFGPHPSILERAEEEVRGEVEVYMELAERAAGDAFGCGGGERVGVVVVERREGRGRVVAVAGDARWTGWGRERCGNVVAHAVMRAVGMVAAGLKAREDVETAVEGQKEAKLGDLVSRYDTGADAIGLSVVPSQLDLERADTDVQIETSQPPEKLLPPATSKGRLISPQKTESKLRPTSSDDADIFKDEPLLPVEKEHYDPSGNKNGYLCHELEIYCTHEPCVMCSMAIVHSRFGRVIFKRRMGETGGLCADSELGHGLFWRKELNWTLLGWQWLYDAEGGKGVDVSPYLHA